MKVNVLSKTENELKIELEGAGHTLCNLLQKKLLEDENVDLAGYDVPHPLASNPILYVRTKGDAKPEEALHRAVEKILELSKEFSKELKKAIKT
ncbi:MAG: RpoL/Rpb11 RNA polymerase subunit family protein [Candidatus Bathycorpusculaceae bacterium]